MSALGRLGGAFRQLFRRVAPRPVILMYHRIAEPAIDPWQMSVSKDNFAGHLEVLRRSATVLAMPEMARALENGRIPRRAVAVTFDDGYVDNLTHAKPLLERYSVPATFFISSGAIGGHREFWWDELERALLSPGRLPGELCVQIGNDLQRWQVPASYSADEYRADRDRRPWEATPGTRLATFYSVWKALRPLSAADLSRTLERILQWAGADLRAREDCRPLDPDELRRFADGGTIDIGAHTVTHPLLTAQPIAVQGEEMVQSKRELETMLGTAIEGFAYPYGEYTPASVDLAEQSGFRWACTTVHQAVERGAGPFELPRFSVPDCNGELFAKHLERCFRL